MDEKQEAPSTLQSMEETVSNQISGTSFSVPTPQMEVKGPSQTTDPTFSAPNVSEKRKLSEGEPGENNEEDESPPKKQQVDSNEEESPHKTPLQNDANDDDSKPNMQQKDTNGDDSNKNQPEGNEQDDKSKEHVVAEDICVEYDMPAFFGDEDDDDDEDDETTEKPDHTTGDDGSNVYYSGQGFHEIVEPGNQGTVPCKACNRPFDSYRGLLQHVTHRKLCKELYGSEIEDLKLAIKLDPTSKKSGPNANHKELVECSGCREQFRSLLSHLSKKPQCQGGYDMASLKATADAAQKEKMKQYYRAKNKSQNKSFEYGNYRGGDSDTSVSNNPHEILKTIMNEHSNVSNNSTQENNDSDSRKENDDTAAVKQEDVIKSEDPGMLSDKDIAKLENGSEAAVMAAAEAAAAAATGGSEDGSGLHPLFPIAGLLHTMQKMNDGSSSSNTNAPMSSQQVFLMNFMNRVKTAQAANALANAADKKGDIKAKPVTTSPASTSQTPQIPQAQFQQRNGGPGNFASGPGNFGRKVGRSGMFMCARCKTGFINKDTYETHLSKSDCSKPQPGTRYPIKKSSSSGVYVCSKCKQGFIGTEVFENHVKTHET